MRGARTASTGWLTSRGALLLALTSVAVWGRVSWCDAVELHLTVPQETLSLNQPVIAHLSVRNTSAESVYLNLDTAGHNHVNVHVRAHGNSSHATADAARNCVECLSSPAAPRDGLGAGAEVSVRLVLNRWHRFVQQGEYEVYVELQTRALVDTRIRADQMEERDGVLVIYVSGEDGGWLEEPAVRSNPVTVTIGPRDEGRLRTLASELLAAAKARDYSARDALAWLVDPVAVPALAELAELGGMEDEVRAAIVRTATPEAVDVLLRLGPPDGPISQGFVIHCLESIAMNASASPVARRRADWAIRREVPGR